MSVSTSIGLVEQGRAIQPVSKCHVGTDVDEVGAKGTLTAVEDAEYPEGGYGWVVVAASASIFFNGWGLSNAWGIFQTYYESRYPDTSPSVISLIGSLQAAMIEGTGMLVGVLMERFGLKKVMLVGAVLQIGALLATSFCDAVWQLYLAQGLAYGVGAGTLYIAAVSVPGQYFDKKKATAFGILYTSSGLGGVVWPIVLAHLFNSVGYGWTVRIVMFISLLQIAFGLFFIKERVVARVDDDHPQGEREVSTHEKAAASTAIIYRDTRLWYIAVGYFILSIGMLSPMFYIGTFAKTIGMSDHLSFYLLAILNAASIPGRTITGILADRWGRLNALIAAIMGAAVVQLVGWSLIRTNAGVIVFAVLYGWVFGGLISLMPAVTAQVLGQHHLATKFGVVSAFGGGGALMGAPVAALWIGSTRESYYGTIIFSGCFVLFSGLWYLGLRIWIDRRIRVKV